MWKEKSTMKSSKYIPYLIKNRLHVDFLHRNFIVYKNEVIIRKTKVITHIPNSMIHVDFSKQCIHH